MKTCEICKQPTLKVRWCVACAKDTCSTCWPVHVPACLNAAEPICHECAKEIRKVGSVEDMTGIIMQSFTGRFFCDQECFDEYLSKE